MNGAADVPLNVVHDEAGCMSMAHVGRVARIEHDICDTYGARQARRHARAATINATAIGARGTMMRPCASHSMRLLRRTRQLSYRVLGSPEGVCEAEPSSSRACQAYGSSSQACLRSGPRPTLARGDCAAPVRSRARTTCRPAPAPVPLPMRARSRRPKGRFRRHSLACTCGP